MLRWMHSTIRQVQAASAFLSVVIPLCVIAFSAWEYVEGRKFETKQHKFENYHLIVERFTGGDKGSVFVIVANIFELRNYPEYKEVSLKILQDMRANWDTTRIPLIRSEIEATMKYLKALKSPLKEKQAVACESFFSWKLEKESKLNAL